MKIFPLSDLEWDQQLGRCPYGEIFHTSFWKNEVTTCIGGTGKFYHCTTACNSWLVPVYMGSPWSTSGFHVGSVGYGGPIPFLPIEDPHWVQDTMKEVVLALENEIAAKCTGFRTFPCSAWKNLQPAPGQILSSTQIISLLNNFEEMFNTVLTGNVRTAVRRAEQLGLVVYQIQDLREQECAYDLLADTQTRVGASYVTPRQFLRNLAQKKECFLFGVKWENKLIGMALLLLYNKKAIHLFHGWKREAAPPGANQLLIWEMIKKSINEGCVSFNMGESHSQELRTAKKRWGSIDVPILKFNF